MGRVQAAIVAADAIRCWKPQVILLVGIAGGVEGEVKLGDVIIPQQIYDYELRKLRVVIDSNGEKQRKDSWRGKSQPVSSRLFEFSTASLLEGWQEFIHEKRPYIRGKSELHHGKIVASGDKSVAVSEVMDELKAQKDHLVGIEMEGAGVASAAWESGFAPEFLMIKAVSDFANEKEGSSATEKWRKYACDAAAAATRKFIELLIARRVFEPSMSDPVAPLKAVIDSNIETIMNNGYLLVFLCSFGIYRALAKTIADNATTFLLWSLDGSPLNVRKVYIQKNNLTKHDEEFSNFVCRNKLRVVVFSSSKDVKEYVNANSESLVRREAFEKSCKKKGGKLRFTCRQLLNNKYRLPPEFHFDFGFVAKLGKDGNTAGYCFHSPFSNKSDPRQRSHVSFFDAQKINRCFDIYKQDKELKIYNVILHSIPYYPRIIEDFRMHAEDQEVTESQNGMFLYRRANELFKYCKKCDEKNICGKQIDAIY
jgi:nucleoside phosphorylase